MTLSIKERFYPMSSDTTGVGPERDHRLAAAPGRHPGRGDASDAVLHHEAGAAKDLLQVTRRLDFLEAQLAEAEQAVHDLLPQLFSPLHIGDRLRLEGFEPRIGWRRRDVLRTSTDHAGAEDEKDGGKPAERLDEHDGLLSGVTEH